jgi:chromate reductase, NAD(P)H dehydrogenase (quinone)
MPTRKRVLAISGSLRSGATTTAALHTAAHEAPAGIEVTVFEDLADLPAFNPDVDIEPLPAPVSALRSAIAASDGVLLSTPEYAGSLPGAFKNLLDWMVGSDELFSRPVGWINTSVSPTGAVAAHEDLRRVLEFVGATLVEDACVDLPVPRASVGPDGLIDDPLLRKRISDTLRALTRAATRRRTATV